MKNEFKVSVYCLAYNHEKYIRQTLDGFVNQKTDFPYEVIVHDDASTDGTAKIIKEYADQYPNIIKPIFQSENQYSKGVRIVKDIIFPLLKGKYIASCEGDDYWCTTDQLQLQHDFLEQSTDYVACACNSYILNMKTQKKMLLNSSDKPYDISLHDMISHWGHVVHLSNMMYRKDAVLKFYSEEQPEFLKLSTGIGDYPLSIFLAISGKFKYIPKVVSVYRYGTSGSWTEKNTHTSDHLVKMYRTLIKVLTSFDEYCNHQYHKEICEQINRYQLQIYREQKQYHEIKQQYGTLPVLSAWFTNMKTKIRR